MRIAILAVGSRGDVQPVIALGRGLGDAGHSVTIATHREFEGVVGASGLAYEVLGGNPRTLLQSEDGLAWLEAGANPVRGTRRLLALARPLLRSLMRDTVAACRGAEAIVFGPLSATGYHVGEAMGVPTVLALLVPAWRTGAFPEPGAPPWNLGPVYNRITHRIGEQTIWQPFRQAINDWRERELGIPRLPALGPASTRRWQTMPVLAGFSPSLVTRPQDWRRNVAVTGYWFPPQDEGWSPPSGLADFLDRGPPPAYVGFGSMPDRRPAELAADAVQALRRAGARGIIGAGWAKLAMAEGDDVCAVDDVPHGWLFPRTAAVVHHGGSGTTHSGLRAGRPTVVVPFFTDQPFWGRRVHAAGVGPPPIARKRLNVDRLAGAIRQAVADAGLRERARRMGTAITREEGVTRAIDHFHRSLAL
jgi:UDP:flavonoid glycosyltransferase YjiC (YdhE family)